MAKKMRTAKGFTLAEILIVILILSLVTLAGTAAVTTVLSVRNRMIQVANAQMLASTAAEAIADELRFGQDMTVAATEDAVTLGSSLYGPGGELCLATAGTTTVAGKGVPARDVPVGQLVVISKDGAREMLGARSYDGLYFSSLHFTLKEAGTAAATPAGGTATTEASVTVAMTVTDGSQDLWSMEFTVVPLNGAKKASP